jgi:aminoglycoside phosphotransferase
VANVQPHPQDPILDHVTVLSLVRRHVPEAQTVTKVDETGGEARTYAVDENIILKTQRPHKIRPKTSLEKEVFFLQELVKYPQIQARIPRVYGYGREGSIEYTCMSRIPGVAVKFADLNPEARKNMLIELGKTLRLIHGIAQEPLIRCGLFPGDRTFQDTKMRLREASDKEIAKIAIRGDDSEKNLSQRIAEKAIGLLPELEGHLVALHSNPAATHTFVDGYTGRYTGTIDFGDAYISHPVMDLRRWGLEDRKALYSGYVSEQPVSENFLRVWNVVNVLDSISRCHNSQGLEELLAELDE